MSRIRRGKAVHFAPCGLTARDYSRAMAQPAFGLPTPAPIRLLAAVVLSIGVLPASAQVSETGITPAHLAAVEAFARSSAERAMAGDGVIQRLEVEVGQADRRLRLAPCSRTEARAVTGAPALGRTRVGLQCLEGATRWSVTIPVTVRAWGLAWVAVRPVPAGSTLTPGDFKTAVVDFAAERSPVLTGSAPPEGRELQRALASGEALRQSHLRARQWFAAGDTVRVLARGPGFTVVGSGQAMGPGLEGQAIKVRTEGGRILSGVATADRSVEVAL